ncbi:MAG: hypothetical protein JNK49_20005 [Planctomycetes bacterium]|nr:hypothetical protein [Planctomycetota bacterium]
MILRSALLLALAALPLGDPIKTSFSVLAGYTYEEGKALPKEITNLDEQVVSISGFMMRETPGSNPVNQFLIINEACGCNGTPKLNEVVFCTLPEGQTMEIKPGIVSVTGKFYVGEVKEEGVVVMLYQIDADVVQ